MSAYIPGGLRREKRTRTNPRAALFREDFRARDVTPARYQVSRTPFFFPYFFVLLFKQVFPRNAGEPRGAAGTAKVNVGTGSAGDGPGGDGDEKDGGNGDKKDKVGRRKALGTRGGGPVGGTPVDVGLQEDQEEEEKARGDGLLHGASEDETRSTDDEACPAPPAPPPAEPLEGSAPPAAVAITGTIGGPGHHDGARQEAVAKRTRARVSVGQASKSGGSPPRNARRRRSTSKAAGNGEGAA